MNDQTLKQLLQQHKQEIPDNGFSSKTMHHLPDRQPVPGLVWIFAIIGTLLFFAISGFQQFLYHLIMLLEKAPWWSLPVACSSLALLFLIGFYFYERKTTPSLIIHTNHICF
jgi:hypothetical protein